MNAMHRHSASQDAPLCPWAQSAHHVPDRPALVDPAGHVISWAVLDAAIEATRLRLESIQESNLALVVTNSREDVILLVAALRSGFDVALFGARLPQAVVASEAAALGARLIDPSWAQDATAVHRRQATGTPQRLSGQTLIRTSGTTGQARWIRHDALAHHDSAFLSTKRLGLTEQHAWGWCLPMHHVGGLSILWRCALVGASVLCPPAHTSLPEWILSGAAARTPTHLSVVPTQLGDLVAAGPPPVNRLRSVIVGGAHVSPSLLTEAVTRGWPVRTTYGMTETASMVTLSDVWTDVPGPDVHAGTPFDGVEICEREGSICIRTSTLGIGLSGPEGWYVTTDTGFTDADGRWVISGRTDRVIISGGENLDPDRIEHAIRSLEGVTACMVVAVPSTRYGQRPVAFLSGLDPLPTPERMADLLGDALMSFEIPDAFHFMPALEPGQAKWSRAELEVLAHSLHRD